MNENFSHIENDQKHSIQRKENLLSLYNALNNTNYTNPDDLILNTIDDVVYMGMKNDVSCIIDQNMSLYEHQSTYNPNMPLRGFMYFGKLYSNYITTNEYSLYSKQQIKIPIPQYYVFYNGAEEIPDWKVLRLSDAFHGSVSNGEFEWIATIHYIDTKSNVSVIDKDIKNNSNDLFSIYSTLDPVKDKYRKQFNCVIDELALKKYISFMGIMI